MRINPGKYFRDEPRQTLVVDQSAGEENSTFRRRRRFGSRNGLRGKRNSRGMSETECFRLPLGIRAVRDQQVRATCKLFQKGSVNRCQKSALLREIYIVAVSHHDRCGIAA